MKWYGKRHKGLGQVHLSLPQDITTTGDPSQMAFALQWGPCVGLHNAGDPYHMATTWRPLKHVHMKVQNCLDSPKQSPELLYHRAGNRLTHSLVFPRGKTTGPPCNFSSLGTPPHAALGVVDPPAFHPDRPPSPR